MKRITTLFAALSFALLVAVPAQAGWAPNGINTDNNSSNPQITNGVWTLTLFGKTRAKYKSHDGESTVLDLRNVNADLAAAGSTLTVAEIDYQGFNSNKIVTDVYLPDYITKLGKQSFMYCSALTNVCISANAVFVDSHVFSCCPNLETVYYNGATPETGTVQIPASVTDIKANVFENGGSQGNANTNYKIKKIIAPGITAIQGTAFQSCAALEYVYAPNATSIGANAFQHCVALDTVVISPNLNFIGAVAFDNSAIATLYPYGQENPEAGTIFLPSTLTTMNNYGHFMGSRSRYTNVVARGMTVVPNRAFQNAPALKTAEFSPNLTVLDSNNTSATDTPFYKCTKLESVYPSTFVSTFTELDTATFRDCNSLTNYFDLSATPITAVPNMWAANTSIAGVTFPATVASFTGNQNFRQLRSSATFRFLGAMPAVEGTGDNAPLRNGNLANTGTSENTIGRRHVIVVDPENLSSWEDESVFVPFEWNEDYTSFSTTNSTVSSKYTASDSDFPTPDHPEETVGVTSWGNKAGSYSWLVKYVDHSTVTATFMDETGTTVLGTTEVEVGNAAAYSGSTPTKDSTAQYDYTFLGWNTDSSASTALSDLTISAATTFYPVFSTATRSYTITWKFDADTVIDTTTVLYGETPTHINPSKQGYRFTGWTPEIATVTGDATYTAVFEEVIGASYTITWLNDDGTQLGQDTVADGDTPEYTGSTPTKASTVDTTFTFSGWSPEIVAVAADATYTATFSSAIRQYMVTFVNEDGTVLQSSSVAYGTTPAYTGETPAKSATAEYTYAFSGWNSEIAAVMGDATYTAQYAATPVSYLATFVDYDGTVLSGPTTYVYGAAVTAPADPEREGYTFAGWAVDGTVVEVSTMPAMNTTYTATYTVNKYAITWVNDNGATIDTTQVEYGTVPTHANPTMASSTKSSYAFQGWSTDGETVISLPAVTGATTYYAVYTRTISTAMSLTYVNAAYNSETGVIEIEAKIGSYESGFEPTVAVAADGATGTATLSGDTISATLTGIATGRAAEWTVTVAQTAYGVTETATLKGRTWVRKDRTWFGSEDVDWTNDAFDPGSTSGAGQQVRVAGTLTFPMMLPRGLPEADGAKLGITALQENAGSQPCFYAWNGTAWVRLYGASPAASTTVQVLGVVDFARKDGAAVAWYADGYQLTTEAGDWEVPLAGGAQLSSFGLVGDLTVNSLSGDYDIGGQGFSILIR